jgi:hypothetical protein
MNNSFQRQKIAAERDLYSIFAAKCYLALLDFKSAEFMFGIKRLEASLCPETNCHLNMELLSGDAAEQNKAGRTV